MNKLLGDTLSGLNFTAIDFETANRQRSSVCSVGMAKVRSGRIVASVSWLVKPPTGLDSFEPGNTLIHGITPSDVADATDWAESLVRIAEFIGDDGLVAHYAAFDKAVFHRSSEAIGASISGDEWHCAWLLAKDHLDLVDYKLPTVASELGIEGLNHHDAESDALTCAQVVLAIASRSGATALDDLWPAPVVQKRGKSGGQKFYSSGYAIKKGDLPTPNPEAHPDHPLYGQHVTVTGDFEKLGRMEAFEAAARCGAAIELNTTLKTTILVVCGEDPHAVDFDLSTGSGKQQKAHQYITERGKSIQILSEHEFLELLGEHTPMTLDREREQILTESPTAVEAAVATVIPTHLPALSQVLVDPEPLAQALSVVVPAALPSAPATVVAPTLPAPPAPVHELAAKTSPAPSQDPAFPVAGLPAQPQGGKLNPVVTALLWTGLVLVGGFAIIFLIVSFTLFAESAPEGIVGLIITTVIAAPAIACGWGLRARKRRTSAAGNLPEELPGFETPK